MNCIHCGEAAVVARGDDRLCGRCAIRADWESVARMAQGLVVREAVAVPVAGPPSGGVAGAEDLAPADPFSA
jgi:hypothetical protein